MERFVIARCDVIAPSGSASCHSNGTGGEGPRPAIHFFFVTCYEWCFGGLIWNFTDWSADGRVTSRVSPVTPPHPSAFKKGNRERSARKWRLPFWSTKSEHHWFITRSSIGSIWVCMGNVDELDLYFYSVELPNKGLALIDFPLQNSISFYSCEFSRTRD